MKRHVKLSDASKALLKHCVEKYATFASFSSVNWSEEIEIETLLKLFSLSPEQLLTPDAKREAIDIQIFKLRSSLLKDLRQHFFGKQLDEENKDGPKWYTHLKLWLLAAVGTIVAAFSGFDNALNILGLFSIPSAAVFGISLVFSVFSVVIFYGFSLVQVSNNLQINLREAPKLLDQFVQLQHEIKKLRQKMNALCLNELSQEELQMYKNMIQVLQLQQKELIVVAKKYREAIHSTPMKVAKIVFSLGGGLLFFVAGYVSGQTVAMFLLSLSMGPVAPTFWPVILISAVVGVASFLMYWYVERVGLEQLVSSWFGLNEEKIEHLCKPEKVEKEEHKLANLLQRVNSNLNQVQKQACNDEPFHGKSLFSIYNKKSISSQKPKEETQGKNSFVGAL